jgi:hypothetical protein
LEAFTDMLLDGKLETDNRLTHGLAEDYFKFAETLHTCG